MGRARRGARAIRTARLEARRRAPSGGQIVCFCLVIAAVGSVVSINAHGAVLMLVAIVHVAFLAKSAWRIVLTVVSRDGVIPAPLIRTVTPDYTILVALHDEAEIVSQLVERLKQIDYPPDRLQGLILLEAHDLETIAAVQHADRPTWLTTVVVPEGAPQTKPRALNHGLAQARGEFVTVYDAEDDPDPLQLRAAASRFAGDRTHRLACLQAPLRIRCEDGDASDFLCRQFAVEYAALFEVVLPGMARLGLPFPLGGTSNHFRTAALRQVGGWDAWNVTEDADLGFRLWRLGWKSDVINRPTFEPPPGPFQIWLPQRTRWLKGFMQTWGVHTRDPRSLGVKGLLALVMTLGFAMAASAMHALALAWVVTSLLIAIVSGLPPAIPALAATVLGLGVASACFSGAIGARRANVRYGLLDMALSRIYWSLLTLAFGHAVWRLAAEPFTWDKTPHKPSRRSTSFDRDPLPVTVLATGRPAV